MLNFAELMTRLFMPHKLSQHRAQCRRVLHVAAGLLLIVLALPVSAHDFWLEPLKFRAKPGDTVPLRLLVGMDFKGNAALYNPEQFERFFLSIEPANIRYRASSATIRPVPSP